MSSIFGNNSRTFSSLGCACPSPTAPSIRISSATAVSKASTNSASPCPGLPAASASAPAPYANRSAASSSPVCSASSVAAQPAIRVLLPDEIRGLRPGLPAVAGAIAVRGPASAPQSPNLKDLDFLKTRALRQSIHLRERGHCFYCLRGTDARVQCLDHVVPRARAGRNSYRNLVSSCLECNSLKGERPAADFLRWLYRQRCLTASELNARLRALDALASGKLPPPVHHPDTPVGTASFPPHSPARRGGPLAAGWASASYCEPRRVGRDMLLGLLLVGRIRNRHDQDSRQRANHSPVVHASRALRC